MNRSSEFFVHTALEVKNMDLILKAYDSDIKIPFIETHSMLTQKGFKKISPLVIYIHGTFGYYNETVARLLNYEFVREQTITPEKMYEAYRCRGDFNFVVSVFNCFLIMFLSKRL